jgi:hypothetical protein
MGQKAMTAEISDKRAAAQAFAKAARIRGL